MIKITITCIFLSLQIKTKKCEEVTSYSAVVAMVKLLDTQAHLIESIGSTLKSVDTNETGIVETYLAKLKKEHALSQRDPEHYLGNPINSYALIMRLYRDLQFVEKILNKTDFYRRNTSLVYPSRTDFDGANSGLVRMQVMYGLDIEQLADGKIDAHFSKTKQRFEEFVSPLTVNDCLDLAHLYFNKEDRTAFLSWLKQAHKRFKIDPDLCQLTEDVLLRSIARSYSLKEDWNSTIYWLEKYLAIKKDDYEAMGYLEKVKGLDKQHKPKPHIPLEEQLGMHQGLMSLCRYESGPVTGNVSLSCYYARGPHPFLLLAPFRAEILHRGPDITMFYDVITDVEIEIIKAYAKPRLRKTKYFVHNGKKAPSLWTSQTTELSYELPEAVRVLQRIRQFSGFQSHEINPDKLTVGNYGLAGFFVPHYDFYGSQGPPSIATALLYLSNVEQGGATAFLHANLTVFPVRNAALFWQNLDPWGKSDFRTKHGSCPVVRGSKWILKWMTLIDQDLSRPCPVYPPASQKHLEKSWTN